MNENKEKEKKYAIQLKINATYITLSFHQESVLIGYPRPLGVSRVGPRKKKFYFCPFNKPFIDQVQSRWPVIGLVQKRAQPISSYLDPTLILIKKNIHSNHPREKQFGRLKSKCYHRSNISWQQLKIQFGPYSQVRQTLM